MKLIVRFFCQHLFFLHLRVGGREGGAVSVCVDWGGGGGAVTVHTVSRGRWGWKGITALGLGALGPTHLHHTLEVDVHRVGEFEGLKQIL